MDWAVFIIDSPESKCLHIHKSSADSYSPSANGRTRVSGMGGQAHSSSPLQVSPVVNLVCVPVGARSRCRAMGQCICRDIGAGDGAVTGQRQTGHCVMHPVKLDRNDLGKN